MAGFRRAPRPELQSRVVALDVVHHEAPESVVLPSTKAVLGVQFRGRVQASQNLLAKAGVTGLQNGTRTYSYLENAGSVLVSFTPQGLTCLGVPAHELTDRNVALSALFPPTLIEHLTDELSTATSDPARADVVERWLMTLPFARDARITQALIRLDQDPPPTIAALARELDLSERQLERRFAERVGMSPKRFSKLRRFERTLPLIADAPTLAMAAQLAGYYDQSHFVRDFQSFTGLSPTELLRPR